jgi:predicted transport protein
MSDGYIYVLFNPSFRRDLFKIGKTTKTPEERAREISLATGVPRDFEVIYEERVNDCDTAERLIHQRLNKHRSSSNREFFELPLKEIIRVVRGAANEVGRVEEVGDQVSEERATIGEFDQDVPQGEFNVVASGQKRRAKPNSNSNSSVTFDDHASFTDSSRREILKKLRQEIHSLDDRLREGETCTKAQRITYKLPGDKVFLEVKVQRSAIILHLMDSGLPDPKGVTMSIPETHGWGDLKKKIKISTSLEAKDAMPFIEGAYKLRLARS